MFENKKLLITGGTGSFGNAVLKKFLTTNVEEIRIFSRDEKKQEDMRIAIGSDRVKFYIGDVRDYVSVSDAMHGVDYVFHAAALKQVPSCEFYPMEAFKTNVIGAENLMRAAISNKVKKCIVLSTDKAVYPINAMGISKAMMEKVMIAYSRMCDPDGTVLCATRYGNVMGSRGSVIPLFLEQIILGKPLTITDPTMTRFLMSLDDSVNLVLYAFNNARSGDIFVQKSPASTVKDLAEAIIQITGHDYGVNIIGTRHGEKLYESLLSREEKMRSLDLGDYYRVPSDSRDLNYSKYFSMGVIDDKVEDYTSHNTSRLNVDQIAELLKGLEFVKEKLCIN